MLPKHIIHTPYKPVKYTMRWTTLSSLPWWQNTYRKRMYAGEKCKSFIILFFRLRKFQINRKTFLSNHLITHCELKLCLGFYYIYIYFQDEQVAVANLVLLLSQIFYSFVSGVISREHHMIPIMHLTGNDIIPRGVTSLPVTVTRFKLRQEKSEITKANDDNNNNKENS